jgi:hypothetical protein
MSEDSTGRRSIGPVTADAIKLFERAPLLADNFRQLIASYSAKTPTRVVDVLTLAYLRNWLEILNPPLPPGEATIGIRIWNYWEANTEEFQRLCEFGTTIADYLGPLGFREEVITLAKQRIVEKILPRKQILDYLPVLETVFATSGPRVTVRHIATRALQMHRDGMTWRKITENLCPCGERKHDAKCSGRIRVSVIALKKVLRDCGIELTEPE